MMKVSVLGIDLGKNVCSIVGLDETGAVVLRRRAKRETLIGLAAKLPPCIVAIVALANKLARIAWAVLRRGEKFTVKGLPLAV